MYQKERLAHIMEILRQQGYVTVNYLTAQLHYSTATVNRDLNTLQQQQLVVRSYGGVEPVGHPPSTPEMRYHKMRVEKNRIAKAAAGYIADGDTVFIDGSTTAQFIGQYITDRQRLTVITNNITLTAFLSEYGIRVICLGGEVREAPGMLDGVETVENAARYHADTAFFSTGGFSADGRIYTTDTYALLHRAMMKNADRVFFLADHDKADIVGPRILADMDEVDGVISDYAFPAATRERCPDTDFLCVK